MTRSQLHVDRVGVRVTLPRTGVQYRTVPKQIVSIIPRFRGYRYIIVEDDIVIIDPKTYGSSTLLRANALVENGRAGVPPLFSLYVML